MVLAAREWVARGGSSFAINVLAANVGARTFYESLGARLQGISSWEGLQLEDANYLLDDLTNFAIGDK